MPMTPRALAAFAAFAFAACAPAARGPAAPTPDVQTPNAPPAPEVLAPNRTARDTSQPAPDWHLLDPAADGVPGTGAARAVRELLANARPRREVVVAVIDGGVDSAHAALRPVLWSNPRETPGNRRDDDGDGLVDDVRGWNYLGYPNGQSIAHERLELTRLAAACTAARAAGAPAPPFAANPGVNATCPQLEARLDSARRQNAAQLRQISAIADAARRGAGQLATALGVSADSLTAPRVRSLRTADPALQRAQAQFLFLAANGATLGQLREAVTELENGGRYNYDPAFNPRPPVGDTPAAGRRYGNGDATGPDASHGTHVAGIVGAAAGVPGDSGTRGVVPAGGVRVMSVRATPDGDERDKDVANAIRYAVDHGALVINMSFGKGYSPDKPMVDSAARYAESRGVLLVHAAGNEGSDNDRAPNYPSPAYVGGGRAGLWLEVGASTWRRGALPARFSNYGRATVDLFAPGQDILSTLPNGTFGRQSGTSMAAPAVSGVAALLLAYFPSLTGADVKRILLATATRYPGLSVARPGDGAQVSFAELSASGGVVNAYEAVRLAQREAAGRPGAGR